MTTKILDISQFQAPSAMDYSAISQQVDGVILRAGYTGYVSGRPKTDAAFERHYAGFTACGVPIGVYWITVGNSPEMGQKEAGWCLERIAGKSIQLGVYADTEWVYEEIPGEAVYKPQDYSRQKLTAAVLAFCETVQAAGYWAGIYASESWFTGHLDMDPLRPYSWWVANYSQRPRIAHDMWQHTSKARLNGYSGNLDLSDCFIDIAAQSGGKETDEMDRPLLYTPWLKRKAPVSALQDLRTITTGRRFQNPFADRKIRSSDDPIVDGCPYDGHKGIDFAVATGTPVYAPFSGSVYIDTEQKAGRIFQINAEGKSFTARHLSKWVVTGGYVTKGQLVAYTGNTGSNSTGPHLHVDVFSDSGCHDCYPYAMGIWDADGNGPAGDASAEKIYKDTDPYEYDLQEASVYQVDTDGSKPMIVRQRPGLDKSEQKAHEPIPNKTVIQIDRRCDLPNGEKWGRLKGKPWHWVPLFIRGHWQVEDPPKPAHRYMLRPAQVYLSVADIQGYSEPGWSGSFEDCLWLGNSVVIAERYDDANGNLFGRSDSGIWYLLYSNRDGWMVKGGFPVTDRYQLYLDDGADMKEGNYYEMMKLRVESDQGYLMHGSLQLA